MLLVKDFAKLIGSNDKAVKAAAQRIRERLQAKPEVAQFGIYGHCGYRYSSDEIDQIKAEIHGGA